MSLPDQQLLTVKDGRTFHLRAARPGDAEGWIDLLKEVAAEGRYIALEEVSLSKRQLSRWFKMQAWAHQTGSIVAVEGDLVIGQLSLIRERGMYSHVAELGMSVGERHRRLGIGAALIGAATEWARQFQVEKLSLNVFPHNDRALALYKKMGFEQEGLRKRQAKFSYGYEDLIEMSRWL